MMHGHNADSKVVAGVPSRAAVLCSRRHALNSPEMLSELVGISVSICLMIMRFLSGVQVSGT